VLVVASKEIRLEANADKTNYMVMDRDQNVRQSHSTKIDNRSFERVEDLIYLVATLTNQNSIQAEIVIFRCRIFCPLLCFPKI